MSETPICIVFLKKQKLWKQKNKDSENKNKNPIIQ